MTEQNAVNASISIDADTLICSGLWTVSGIETLRAALDDLALPPGDAVSINGIAVAAIQIVNTPETGFLRRDETTSR